MTKIIDNFLDKKYFEELQKLVLGVEFSWFFQKSVNTNQKDKDWPRMIMELMYMLLSLRAVFNWLGI